MTLATFLRRLRATPREWRLRRGPGGEQEIRLGRHCPISAVASDPQGSIAWRKSADHLGLDPGLAMQIALAADQFSPFSVTLLPLRRRLLRACGLEEKR